MAELRQDLISGDWVILAPGRGKRPHFLEEKKPARTPTPIEQCPFEDLEASGNVPIKLYPEHGTGKDWKIALIHNKYPALVEPHDGMCSVPLEHGLYHARTGVGEHWLAITRDHNHNLAELDEDSAFALVNALQDCHRLLENDACVAYASSFFNWGASAGASVWHPHYQILALPIVPSHVARSLRGAKEYFAKHGRCGRCDIVKAERREKKRVIAENEYAIAFAPYASKKPFEVSIIPKKHSVYFRMASPAVTRGVLDALRTVMRFLKANANDPDMNVFIHDAPFGRRNYDFHHWHIELVPKISTPAGFELSTGIDINTTDPEEAAKILRGEG